MEEVWNHIAEITFFRVLVCGLCKVLGDVPCGSNELRFWGKVESVDDISGSEFVLLFSLRVREVVSDKWM